MLIDSHCHLDFPQLYDDLDGVIARAADVGVERMVTICTSVAGIEKALGIAERFPQVYAAIGIHPHNVEAHGVLSVEEIAAWAEHPKVIGIGETGLDYHYDKSPREMQRESFVNHIQAAKMAGVPFIVHTRNADEDTAAILRENCGGEAGVGLLHCFSSTKALAHEAVGLGLYVSFAGILTFNSAEDIRQTAASLPHDRLLVETDSPYLAPVPKRGKDNEPAYTVHTAARLGEVLGISATQVADVTSANFLRLFPKVVL